MKNQETILLQNTLKGEERELVRVLQREMNGKFGQFVEEKRKAVRLTLRGLAEKLKIAPAFMSDIEKGRRYPPGLEKLTALATILELSKEETDHMFDLAARERENTVSPDLPEYIMGNDCVRLALRTARDKKTPDSVWQQVVDLLNRENEAKTE